MYRDENVFHKVDRALRKINTLLISNKREFNHFFKSNQARNTDRKVRSSHISEREARRPLLACPRRAHSCELRAMRMCERSEQIFLVNVSAADRGPLQCQTYKKCIKNTYRFQVERSILSRPSEM